MIRWLLARLGIAHCQDHGDGYVCFLWRSLSAWRKRVAATQVEGADATPPPVHICLWASQPDLLVACDHQWTTAKWGNTETGVPAVYSTDDGLLYTFDEALTTCADCLETLADTVKREQAGVP